jgi:hypothetical protein
MRPAKAPAVLHPRRDGLLAADGSVSMRMIFALEQSNTPASWKPAKGAGQGPVTGWCIRDPRTV